MDTTPDLLLGEEHEPSFGLVRPGGAGRREVQVIARVASEPCPDSWGLVRGLVVEDEMNIEIGRHCLLDVSEELA